MKGREEKQIYLLKILFTVKRGLLHECGVYMYHSCTEASLYPCKTGINLVVTPFSVPHTCTKCYCELL
jgi:hypothetical protein